MVRPASPVGLIGFKMGLIGFVFLDTDAISLGFLRKNWLCFAISLYGKDGGPPERRAFARHELITRHLSHITFLVGFGLIYPDSATSGPRAVAADAATDNSPR